VLEAARDGERFGDGGQIVSVRVECLAEGVDVAKRRKELERARKQALALKQLEQPSGARSEKAVVHPWHSDRAGVDQHLCARRASEVLLGERVEAVAIGPRGESQQPSVIVVVVRFVPGEQRRVLGQQLLQAFDVVVVNDASSLLDRPFETHAKPFAYLRG